jgi:hypothetical protein
VVKKVAQQHRSLATAWRQLDRFLGSCITSQMVAA